MQPSQHLQGSLRQLAAIEPETIIWIAENHASNEFAASLAGYMERTGGLTPRQIEAVKAKLTPSNGAAALDVSEIVTRFMAAMDKGIKTPRMRLDTFVFKQSKGEAIYVTEESEYLGKVIGGKFLPTFACTNDQKERIIAAASNPAESAKAYGQRTGCCSICRRELTAIESIERFIGPICADKYGI